MRRSKAERPRVPPTLADVAHAAGVSKSTASRVLSSARASDDELARRVKEAALELGYRPHHGARSLRRAETKTIGIVYHSLDNPGQLDLLRGLGARSHERGYTLLVADSLGDAARYETLVSTFFERRVDGLILDSPGAMTGLLEAIRDAGIPILGLYGRDDSTPWLPVHPGSEERAVHAAVTRLASLGHRRFGYIHSVEALRRRPQRLRDAITAACGSEGCIEIVNVPEPHDQAVVREAVACLLREPAVTALFVDHRSVPVVVGHLRERRLEIPRDLSLVSFSESTWARGFAPHIATIKVDVELLGQELAQSLIDWIQGTPPDPNRPPRQAVWLERSSVGRPRGETQPVSDPVD